MKKRVNRPAFFAHTNKMVKKILRVGLVLLIIVLSCSFFLTAVLSSAKRLHIPAVVKGESVLLGELGAHYEAGTSARAMATVDVASGRILYAKNADKSLPMASTTKILTAITVIEAVQDLNETVNINPKAIGVEGTSIYLQKGEKLTVRELLLGLMLRSGNDAAMALALHVAKTKEDFAEMMNTLAKKCGAVNSSFKNPHGLDEESHRTTAADLARISAYAMKNPAFAEIAGTKSATIPGVEYKRVLQNKNRLLCSLDGCVGVKTGFTKKAGRCYVGAREANGMTTVCVVLNCGPMFEETAELLRAAAAEFCVTQILKQDEPFQASNQKNSGGVAAGISMQDFSYPLRNGEEPQISVSGGNVTVLLDGREIFAGECIELNVA